MITKGEIRNLGFDMDGRAQVTLTIQGSLADLEPLSGEELSIEIKKYKKHRSLNANAYFWQLADKIAKKLNSDKDTVYLLQLSKYGVFTDLEIKRDALPILREHFRYVEEFDDGYEDNATVRCYYGSSGYNTQEMSDLINGTVKDAKELGIEVLTPDELNRMLASWKGEK